MTPYFLLRDNKQSGPYSLEQLKSLDLKTTDLLWKEGSSALWRNPHELDELVPFLDAINETKQVLELRLPEEEPVLTAASGTNLEVPVDVKYDNERLKGENPPVSPAISPEISESEETKAVKNTQPSGPIKVIVADDHSLFREGVKLALSHKHDVEIIAEAENGVHLLNLLKHHKPDVILLDIEMPVMDGIAALKEIRKLYGNLKVIILSMHDARSMVTTLMKTGANSYLTKSADSATIYKAIKGVHSNDFHYTDLSSKSMIEALKEDPKLVVKERVVQRVDDKSDMMLKLREINKRHTVRMPSRKRKRRSMILLVASIFTAIVVLGIFYVNDQAPKNKIMYAGPFPDSSSPKSQSKDTVVVLQAVEPVPASEQQTINDLLREQDSIIQSRRSINIPKQSLAPSVASGDDALNKPARPKRVVRETPEPLASESEAVVAAEPEKPAPVVNKPVDSPVVKDKGLALYQLRNQLSVVANEYGKGVFGGVYDIQLTVTNRSSYHVDDVTVQLEYLLGGKKVHRTTLLHVKDLGPASSKVISAPKNSRGVSIQYWITSCTSKEIE